MSIPKNNVLLFIDTVFNKEQAIVQHPKNRLLWPNELINSDRKRAGIRIVDGILSSYGYNNLSLLFCSFLLIV